MARITPSRTGIRVEIKSGSIVSRRVTSRTPSVSGAQLVNVPHGLIINDRIALITRLDEEMVEVRCRVAYVRENPIKPVIGVEFLDVDGENTGKLLSFVCKLGIELIRR